jgi:hypothetical protein
MNQKVINTTTTGVSTKANAPLRRTSNQRAFWLVVIMLATLLVIIIVLFRYTDINSTDKNFIEYSKWTMSLLISAFGAWIGAGAAYFFGKENLAESSASTEEALRIQSDALQGAAKPGKVSELSLTIINQEFIFKPDDSRKSVTDKLATYRGYWWVPIVNQLGNGTLTDIIHARVFWDNAFNDADKISKIITDIDTVQSAHYSSLHGKSFYAKVSIDDKITDIISDMDKTGAVVAIVVDEKDRPTFCISKQDLQNTQRR